MNSFSSFLNEGLIKLPRKTLQQLVGGFVYIYLAYYKDCIEEFLSGKEYHDANELLKTVLKKYNVPSIKPEDSAKVGKSDKMTKIFVIDPEDLPERYLKKLREIDKDETIFRSLNLKIKLTIDFKGMKKLEGSYAQFDPNNQQIIISIKNHYLDKSELESRVGREKCLGTVLTQAIGNLEHEFTHAIQWIILEKFHQKQIKNISDLKIPGNSPVYQDEYYNTPIEFDPWIKTEIKKFKAAEDLVKMTRFSFDKKAAIGYFTWSDSDKNVDIEKLGFTGRSEFFGALKKKSEKRWKKAVKLFYTEVA